MMNENMSELLGRVEREVEAQIAKWGRDRTKQLLKAFEAGANDIPRSQVAAFAEALDCTVAYLMEQEDMTWMP